MRKEVHFCDKCGKVMEIYEGIAITIHFHHDTRIDLCKSCLTTLRKWLNPNLVSPSTDRDLDAEARRL